MAVTTLDVTIGGASANAYCTLAVADQYHEDRPPSKTTWADASDAKKNAAILFATLMLDSLVEWRGFVVTDTQALLWPRYGMTKRNGYELLSSVIPVELQNACAEYARQLLAADRTADSDIETQGIKSLSVAGAVSLSFKDSVFAKVIPDVVVNLLVPGWYSRLHGVESGVVELIRA